MADCYAERSTILARSQGRSRRLSNEQTASGAVALKMTTMMMTCNYEQNRRFFTDRPRMEAFRSKHGTANILRRSLWDE
jgi:hypothetical protein